MNYGLPSLLKETNNWGAFLFFASFGLVALFYVFFMVPETSELSTEEIDNIFRGPWFNAYKTDRAILEGVQLPGGNRVHEAKLEEQ